MKFSIKKDLVFLYGENARVRIKELASVLKKSSQRIKYSLKAIEKEGVIYSPYCIFDYSYFGLVLFRVYFKGAYIREQDKSEIIKKLTENEYVISVYELSGEFDLVIEIEAPNPSRFNKVLKSIVEIMPTLKHYKIILNLVTHLYPRFHLTKEEVLQSYVPLQIIIGGDREVVDFSENELEIMKNLLENPKLRITALAKKSDLSIKTAKSVLKSLYKKNIIKGFKYIMDTEKLDVYKSRLFLNLHNLSKEREEELMGYLIKTREVVQAHKTVGDWDLEIDVESADKTRIRQLTIELRENFKDIIETFNIMDLYHYYSRAYLPRYYFKQKEKELENSEV